jgi:hypothetical protein
MSTRAAIGIAVAGNGLVAAATYAVRGWGASGAHAAARHTARFSLLWFVVAFAAPGLMRFTRSLPSPAALVRAFVGAHLVHFATVLALVVGFESSHVAEHPGQSAAVIGLGAAIVILLGLTASFGTSRFYAAVHRVALYVVFLIFFAAYVKHPVHPLRAISVVLVVALILRLTSGWTYYRASAGQEKSRAAQN